MSKIQGRRRTTPQTVQALYRIADEQGWLVGETLERALAALQVEARGPLRHDPFQAVSGGAILPTYDI
jgi:hypothetical protein